jgi:serine/threonine-protein kinase RsbW
MTDVIERSAVVTIELDSRPESVTLVRSALSGLGERLGLDGELIDDLKTSASEACNNVVVHAYPSGTGPLIVSVGVTPDRVDVLVRDRGTGIQRVSATEDRMGVGLAVISALADRAEFLSRPGSGTDVRMSFTCTGSTQAGRSGAAPALVDQVPLGLEPAPLALGGDVLIWLSPVSILSQVFGRTARAAAAGSHFSVARFTDLHPITDALADYAEHSGTIGPLTCSITASSRRLELALAPFTPGTGARLGRSATVPDGTVPEATRLAGLADELSVEQLEGGELLRIVVLDPRPAAAVAAD